MFPDRRACEEGIEAPAQTMSGLASRSTWRTSFNRRSSTYWLPARAEKFSTAQPKGPVAHDDQPRRQVDRDQLSIKNHDP